MILEVKRMKPEELKKKLSAVLVVSENTRFSFKKSEDEKSKPFTYAGLIG